MLKTSQLNLSSTYLRLGGNGSVEPIPVDETFWRKISTGQFGTFHNEFLVSYHTFDEDWTMWELHPNGDEIVCLLSGSVTFVLEQEGGNQSTHLTESGSCVIAPKGAWHTAEVDKQSHMLFHHCR